MITSVNYINLIKALLVPDKRTPNNIAWNTALVDRVDNEHINIFNYYKAGQIAPFWSATTYNIDDRVRYGKTIFQNTISGNTIQPTFDNTWVVISDNFIGVDNRVLFTGEKLTLEFALNQWFDTQFKQPPLVSDIYISTNSISDSTFIVGNIDDETSLVGNNTSLEFITDSYINAATFYNMIIWVPNIKLSTLGTTLADQQNTVRVFGDKYVNAGITYAVSGY